MTEKKRDLNLDLIRSLALVFVLGMHYYDNSGFYLITIDGTGDFLMAMGRMLCATCVPLFIMLTGRLCSAKKLSAKYYLGMLRIMEIYFISCLACLVFEALYLHNIMSLQNILSGILNFELDGYAWYLLLYGGLFLMMPFLNMMYSGCSGRNQKLLLIVTFFALSLLSSLLNSYVHIYPLW
ncbi:MAG: acyltransferase family protein [Oscillospiraceae bacterium]